MSPATCEIDDTPTTVDVDPLPNRWVKVHHRFYDPGFKASVVEQLNDLRRLRFGWDGYRGAPISKEIITAAIAMINALDDHIAPRPRVVPTTSGGLQLEWNRPDRALELEFEKRDMVHYLRWEPAALIEDEDFTPPTDMERIHELIKWFARTDY